MISMVNFLLLPDLSLTGYIRPVWGALSLRDGTRGAQPERAKKMEQRVEKVNRKLGGTAFPHPGREDAWSGEGVYPSFGMSLRDWFAGRAMAALIAGDPQGTWIEPIDAAKRAYSYADALIAQRAKDLQETAK